MDRPEERSWVETAAVTAPALIGAAAGIILSDLMRPGARRPAATILTALGVAAVAPLVSGVVANKVKGPQTKRGIQRTLRGIRESGANYSELDVYEDDEHLAELGIG